MAADVYIYINIYIILQAACNIHLYIRRRFQFFAPKRSIAQTGPGGDSDPRPRESTPPQRTKQIIDGQFARLKPSTVSHFDHLRLSLSFPKNLETPQAGGASLKKRELSCVLSVVAYL